MRGVRHRSTSRSAKCCADARARPQARAYVALKVQNITVILICYVNWRVSSARAHGGEAVTLAVLTLCAEQGAC